MRYNSRPAKTKRNIKRALLILLNEKDISEITISELAKTAEISRKTFYLHYTDFSEILDEIKNDLVALFNESVMKDKRINFRIRILNFINNIVSRINQDEEYYSLIANSRYAKIIFSPLEELLKSELLLALEIETNLDSTKKECLVDFLIGGIVNCILNWSKNPYGVTTEMESALLFEILYNNVAVYITNDKL